MSGFAGARSLDERRRRRLAVESDEGASEALPASLPKRTPLSLPKASAKIRGPAHFPLRKLISARLWKHAGIAAIGLLLAAAILAGGCVAEFQASRVGPGFVRIFNLTQARLVAWFVSAALFLGGQLAWLIWWLRSQSLQDFNGRYRGWACCAFLGFGAAVAIQTDALHAWSQTVQWLCRVDFWNQQTLCWLLPAICCGLPAWRFLQQEMRDSRLSSVLLWLSALSGAGLAASLLGRPLPLPALGARLIECGTAMLAALCLFLSLLFQARRAIYVSVEPPADRPRPRPRARRPSWLLTWYRQWRSRVASAKSGRKAALSRGSTPTASIIRRRKRAGHAGKSERAATKRDAATHPDVVEPSTTVKPETSESGPRDHDSNSSEATRPLPLNRRERRLLRQQQIRTGEKPLRRSA